MRSLLMYVYMLVHTYYVYVYISNENFEDFVFWVKPNKNTVEGCLKGNTTCKYLSVWPLFVFSSADVSKVYLNLKGRKKNVTQS